MNNVTICTQKNSLFSWLSTSVNSYNNTDNKCNENCNKMIIPANAQPLKPITASINNSKFVETC